MFSCFSHFKKISCDRLFKVFKQVIVCFHGYRERHEVMPGRRRVGQVHELHPVPWPFDLVFYRGQRRGHNHHLLRRVHVVARSPGRSGCHLSLLQVSLAQENYFCTGERWNPDKEHHYLQRIVLKGLSRNNINAIIIWCFWNLLPY